MENPFQRVWDSESHTAESVRRTPDKLQAQRKIPSKRAELPPVTGARLCEKPVREKR